MRYSRNLAAVAIFLMSQEIMRPIAVKVTFRAGKCDSHLLMVLFTQMTLEILAHHHQPTLVTVHRLFSSVTLPSTHPEIINQRIEASLG